MPTSTSKKHKKDKSKKSKPLLTETAPEGSATNEGLDLNWAYQPPPDVKAITANEDNGEFDWDAVKEDDDVEVWVIRLPDNVKPKHLEGLSLDLTAAAADSSKKGKQNTSRIGSLKRKHMTYDVWSLGDEDKNATLQEAHIPQPVIGGEELRSLTCLLPRKSKKGELYPAPRPIARHLIVSAQLPESSTFETSSTVAATRVNKNPPREKYPEDLLTHRFLPYGSLVDPNHVPPPPNGEQPAAAVVPVMEVDGDVHEAAAEVEVSEKEPTKKKSKKKVKMEKTVEEVNTTDANEVMEDVQMEPKVEKEKKKGKKRKGEDQEEGGASTKKSKKAKTSR